MKVTLCPDSLVCCLVLLISDRAKNPLLVDSWLVYKGGIKHSWLTSLASDSSFCLSFCFLACLIDAPTVNKLPAQGLEIGLWG